MHDEVLTIRFNNSGLRAAESFLGDSGDMLRQRVMQMQISDRIEAALLFGGTRRHHARDYPDEVAIDELIDAIKDYYEDEDDEDAAIDNYYAPMLGAYMRTNPKNIAALMKGEDPPEDVAGSRSQRRKNGKKAGPKAVKETEEKAEES